MWVRLPVLLILRWPGKVIVMCGVMWQSGVNGGINGLIIVMFWVMCCVSVVAFFLLRLFSSSLLQKRRNWLLREEYFMISRSNLWNCLASSVAKQLMTIPLPNSDHDRDYDHRHHHHRHHMMQSPSHHHILQSSPPMMCDQQWNMRSDQCRS